MFLTGQSLARLRQRATTKSEGNGRFTIAAAACPPLAHGHFVSLFSTFKALITTRQWMAYVLPHRTEIQRKKRQIRISELAGSRLGSTANSIQ
jgi:hypothetical protein